MEIENNIDLWTSNSSGKGEINTTYWTLVDTFGEPTQSGSDELEDKLTVCWWLLIDNVKASVYDWNTGKDKTQNLIWNIGGATEGSYWKVKEAIGYKSRQKLNMSNNINATYNAHLLHGR